MQTFTSFGKLTDQVAHSPSFTSASKAETGILMSAFGIWQLRFHQSLREVRCGSDRDGGRSKVPFLEHTRFSSLPSMPGKFTPGYHHPALPKSAETT